MADDPMATFEFSHTRIDNHTERMGFDVRPIIEVKMERERLFELGSYLCAEVPQLFAITSQGDDEFSIKKKLIFVGKGEVEVTTLALTNRGPVFTFPRTISAIGEETDLPKGPTANDLVVRKCLRKFRDVFPDRQIVRAGKVNDYVFGCDQIPPHKIISARFLSRDRDACTDALVRLNLATDDLNRNVQVQSVAGIVRARQQDGTVQKHNIFGISVTADVNNINMDNELSFEQMSTILTAADEFNGGPLYRFLNGEDEE